LLQIDLTVFTSIVAIIWLTIAGVYGLNIAFTVLLYLIVVVFVVGMPFLIRAQLQTELRQLQDVQKERGGSLTKHWISLFSPPSLTFEHDGASVHLSTPREDDGARIQLTLDCPDCHGQVTVASADMLSRLAELVGLKDIAIGYGLFDDAYVVKADDPDTALRLLPRKVQRCVREIPEQKALSISIKNQELTVSALRDYQSKEPRHFVDAVLTLYDELKRAANSP